LGHAGQKRLLLVCPPFQNPRLSSLSTAHLATLLRERGGHCQEAYLHFGLAGLIGIEKYMQVGDGTSLTGELLFAEGLHGIPQDRESRTLLDAAFGKLTERQAILQEFERQCLQAVDFAEFDLVGLTTSFNQLLAALWLARLIKRCAPGATIVLGGASCTQPMGARVLESYPQVDLVVSGWGEQPLLALSRGEGPQRGLIEQSEPIDLDALPIPDYAAFLEAARGHLGESPLTLTFESSRGCWWGQKQHCRFCGVNGEQLGFYTKSSQRVVHEIRTLWQRHGRNLIATDAILSREHLREVIPELGGWEGGPKLFYEMKTNVTEAEVAALARARVQSQPGVESLNTRLLKLMRKGVSAIQNLAFLKWCGERRVPIAWNLLYAIPGECEADYEAQIALIPWIFQFPPPERINPIHLARHSPFFDQRDQFGWREVRPRPEYRGMHPQLDSEALQEIAKYFVGRAPVCPEKYLERLDQAVSEWQARNQRGEGLFLDSVHGLVRNQAGSGFRYDLSPPLARLLECTHQVASLPRVLDHVGCSRDNLTQLERLGLLYIEGNQILNLTLRTGLAHPAQAAAGTQGNPPARTDLDRSA
jgi:ribosomal peptide maturation radical SAM protein 1